jgi:hypothetical protein
VEEEGGGQGRRGLWRCVVFSSPGAPSLYRGISDDPVNDHQSDLEIRDDPYAFYEVLLVVEP